MLFVLGTVVGGGGADIMDDDAGVEDVAELTVEFEPGKYLKLETSTSIAKLAELQLPIPEGQPSAISIKNCIY